MRALIAAALLLGTTPSTAAELTIKFTGIKKSQGSIVLCLWAQEGKFPDCETGPVVQRIVVPVGATEAKFSGVAPGTYAVSGFHDANGNNRMDTNFVGMPLEAVALSNNPKAGFGPPKFKASQFRVNGDAAIAVKFATM